MAFLSDYADLADRVYSIIDDRPNEPLKPNGKSNVHLRWQLVDKFCATRFEVDGMSAEKRRVLAEKFGLGLGVYYNDAKQELVFAIRGTENFFDKLSDLYIWQARPHPNQYRIDDDANHIHSLAWFIGNLYFCDSLVIMLIRAILFPNLFFSKLQTLLLVSFLRDVLGLTEQSTFNEVMSKLIELLAAIILEREEYLVGFLNRQARDSRNFGLVDHFLALLSAQGKNPKTITFVGHSMGAHIASLSACRFRNKLQGINVQAVVFESPGIGDVLEKLTVSSASYEHDNYNFITVFNAAPNIVNMCQTQIGNVYRLYISHVDEAWRPRVRHVARNVGKVGARTLAGLGGALGSVIAAPLTDPSIVGAAAGAAPGSALVAMLNMPWLFRQHKKEILCCFVPDSNLVQNGFAEMLSWPRMGVLASTPRILQELLYGNPGETIWPNHIHERRVFCLSEYTIEANRSSPHWVVNSIRVAAEQGNAEAQFILGQCYNYGQSIERDEAEAIDWYCQAAKQGHVRAREILNAKEETLIQQLLENRGDVIGTKAFWRYGLKILQSTSITNENRQRFMNQLSPEIRTILQGIHQGRYFTIVSEKYPEHNLYVQKINLGVLSCSIFDKGGQAKFKFTIENDDICFKITTEKWQELTLFNSGLAGTQEILCTYAGPLNKRQQQFYLLPSKSCALLSTRHNPNYSVCVGGDLEGRCRALEPLHSAFDNPACRFSLAVVEERKDFSAHSQ